MNECGCEAVKDQESWHRHRRTPLCPSARQYRQAKHRERYARRRARQGHVVTPQPRRGAWVPGTDVTLPEEDPL